MVKKLVTLLTVILIISTVLTGCGGTTSGGTTPSSGGTTTNSAGTAPSQAKPMQLFLLTGSSGGTFFGLGGAMSTTWNKNLAGKYQVSPQPTGASVENLKRLGKGEAALGMADNNIADMAWKGEGDAFKDTGAIQNFRGIGNIYPEVFHGVAPVDSNINTIADLKGKKVAIGPPGSGTYVICTQVFSEFGLTINDFTPINAGFGDAASKFKDRQIDSSWGALNIPASQIMDIMTVRKIKFIEIKPEDLKRIKTKYPFFDQFIIPTGTYGNDKEIYTFNVQATLYCKADLPDDVVYDLTKTYFEKSAETAAAHSAGKYISLKTALVGLTTPLHPGAVKYYKEQGITIPENIMPK